MLEKRDCDDYTRDKLSLVSGQLTRIQGILRELIDFSRPASHERTKFPLHEIVHEALRITQYYKGTKLRKIHNRVPKELGLIAGVRDQLVQVVFNLVLNAIDATHKGGIIELRAEQHGNRVQLEVEDNGCGIPLDHQGNLFKPYFTTKKQGTGLGLFVIQKLIHEHGGTVAFHSRVGQGTSFRIELPAEPLVIRLEATPTQEIADVA
jgi:signal transduction histidine kinase